MCVVSNLGDWGRSQGIPWKPWPNPGSVPPVDNTSAIATRIWEEFKKLMDAAKVFDAATGQPDCEVEEKTAWMKDVEERLKKLEE